MGGQYLITTSSPHKGEVRLPSLVDARPQPAQGGRHMYQIGESLALWTGWGRASTPQKVAMCLESQLGWYCHVWCLGAGDKLHMWVYISTGRVKSNWPARSLHCPSPSWRVWAVFGGCSHKSHVHTGGPPSNVRLQSGVPPWALHKNPESIPEQTMFPECGIR